MWLAIRLLNSAFLVLGQYGDKEASSLKLNSAPYQATAAATLCLQGSLTQNINRRKSKECVRALGGWWQLTSSVWLANCVKFSWFIIKDWCPLRAWSNGKLNIVLPIMAFFSLPLPKMKPQQTNKNEKESVYHRLTCLSSIISYFASFEGWTCLSGHTHSCSGMEAASL